MKTILISNDDGVLGPGILATKQALEGIANTVVVAPQENNSAVGRKVNIMKHMYLDKYELADGSEAYGLSGTPADSVNVGINYVCDEKPDLVVTGINPGINISRFQ
ncbi:MAG: 5'/3'-nucleotidase SurE, partial [Methanobrevibacter sp.]|nr:5'/3'-nucleotidase SurE [Methanobrevibacter sp.]